MAVLTRTNLTTPAKHDLVLSLLKRQGEYGAISQLAETFGLSRTTLYGLLADAQRLVAGHVESSDQAVVQWRPVGVDARQIERTVVSLRVVGLNSIRAIEALVPLLYPGVRISYGKIQSILAKAERRAAEFNAKADLTGIKAGALDEMFSQGDPVLAGIDLDTGYLFALEHKTSRKAEDWEATLRAGQGRGLRLEVVVKDAAQAIGAGVRAVFPEAEQRADCFHALRAIGRQLQRLERKAWAAIAAEVSAEEAIEKLKRSPSATRSERHSLDIKLGQARARCQQVLDEHDAFAKAAGRAREAVEIVDLAKGRLRTPEEMERTLVEVAQSMQQMLHPESRKVGRHLEKLAPELVAYAGPFHEHLDELQTSLGLERDLIVLGCINIRLIRDLREGRRPHRQVQDKRHLAGAYAMLRTLAGARTTELLEAVDALFQHRHRASSAIEGFNAALRPHLYVHKRATQGFLELFRAWLNLRTRRWGRHKGTSAHQCLTGEPVADWLSRLGYPPSPALN